MRWTGVMTLAAIAIVSSGCVAHHGGWRHDRQQDRHRDAYRVGYDRGYDEGFRHGRIDGHRRDSYGFRRAPGYRHADRGYRGPYGSRDRYVDGYRRGYERGYRKAFDAERRAHRSRGHHCRSGRRGVERDRYGVRRPGREG